MTLKKRVKFLIDYFEKAMPHTESELQFSNPYQLLVATILAAQCTDKRVNMVTPALFATYPTPSDLAKASVEEILSFVKSVSYPNSKSAHLSEMAKKVVVDFNNQIPSTMEELISLPGVGRKTANVVLAFGFGKPAMPVDTHVFRVSHRLKLVENASTPEAVEKQLVKLFPTELISDAHHWLLLHGRYTCLARKPKCGECPLSEICPSKT